MPLFSCVFAAVVGADKVVFGSHLSLVLSCPAYPMQSDDAEASYIRIVVNDGPVPLTGVRGCSPSPSGLCPLATFIEAQKATIQEVDWEWGCHGDWEVPEGSAWETLGGWYPK